MFWFDLALLFNAGIFLFLGKGKALEFFGGYIIEQSLSIDNLFLFIIVFASLGIKMENQRRILNYGIAGACVLRLIFIFVGITIVNMFQWVLYIFGVSLILSGIFMTCKRDDKQVITESRFLKLLNKVIPFSDHQEKDKFFLRKNKRWYATPLFVALIFIEFSDIIFAIDSIPAIFSITTDPFIVYTSNIFAILGLRNMYFVLGKLHEKFYYVKYGVAAVLTFTGIKLTVLIFNIHIPTEWSLLVIFLLLAISVLTSITLPKKVEI
jgi:tellurite resistance protein TerC